MTDKPAAMVGRRDLVAALGGVATTIPAQGSVDYVRFSHPDFPALPDLLGAYLGLLTSRLACGINVD